MRVLVNFLLVFLFLCRVSAFSQNAFKIVPLGVKGGIDESKLVDLTYPLDERTVFWPSNRPFTWEKSSWGKTTQG